MMSTHPEKYFSNGKMWQHILAFVLCLVIHAPAQAVCEATPGGDGSGTVAGTPGPLLYFQPTASRNAGTTNIPVTSAAGLSPGDMLLVIQMQGATIDSRNNQRYGDGVNAQPASGWQNNANFTAGRYEYAVVDSIVGNQINLVSPLANNYVRYVRPNTTTAQGQRRYQVIRVPQYTNLSLTGDVTAPPWNGETGGVLPLDVAGDLNFNGYTISMSGRGFRGGGTRVLGGQGGGSNNDYRNLATNNYHSSKGEGIAGTPRYVADQLSNALINLGNEGYPNGSHGMGAPGNAGGGGTDGNPNNNDQNSGGGGGGNGGDGGRGGNTWSSNLARGGYGGKAFPASVDRIVMGGGGGGASQNNAGNPAHGGAGGGIVLVRAGRLVGAGVIDVNGADGQTPANDGGGGGGAGGSVIVTANQQIGSITINALGGNGGNAHVGGVPHGPGGGGGGGVVFSNPEISPTVNNAQGASGYTVNPGTYFGASPSGGNTGSEVPNADPDTIVGADSGADCIPASLSILKSVDQATANPGDILTYTITVTNVGLGKAHNVYLVDALGGFTDFVPDSFGPGQHFLFSDSVANPSGLSLGTLQYSENGGTTYQAIPGSAGWETRMTHWRIDMSGIMNRDGQFTIQYQQQVD